jgi:hypothetical protein
MSFLRGGPSDGPRIALTAAMVCPRAGFSPGGAAVAVMASKDSGSADPVDEFGYAVGHKEFLPLLKQIEGAPTKQGKVQALFRALQWIRPQGVADPLA